MRGNDENLNVRPRLPIEDVVGEARYSITPDAGRKLDPMAMRSFANFDHCHVEGGQITRAKPRLAILVVGDVF